jgi:hypothetical protein
MPFVAWATTRTPPAGDRRRRSFGRAAAARPTPTTATPGPPLRADPASGFRCQFPAEAAYFTLR